MTSYALSGDDAKALAAGIMGYVTEPFSPRQLLAKVREQIGRPAREEEAGVKKRARNWPGSLTPRALRARFTAYVVNTIRPEPRRNGDARN